ncbi:MAG TPA: T9SS type A sorting domain-containing protein [Mucilaginibacter sp.]|nr:T9SS type A sorting domain-containing protein [Mucilaginibacter sp.]
MNFAFTEANAVQKSDTIILHAKNKLIASKTSYQKNGLHLALPPLKPAVTSNLKVSVARNSDKLLQDVLVYPNPVTDLINVKYSLSRNAIVSVKIMDILGNDVITIISQSVTAGDQNITYPISNKLSRGLYFIRIVAGTESVIKRITVL